MQARFLKPAESEVDEAIAYLDQQREGLGDRFEQVILITHIEAVRDGLDHVITVRYDPATASSVVDPVEGDETVEALELVPAGAG